DQQRQDHLLAENHVGGVAADLDRVAQGAADVLELVVVAEPDLAQPGGFFGAGGESVETCEDESRRTAVGAASGIDKFGGGQVLDGSPRFDVPDPDRQTWLLSAHGARCQKACQKQSGPSNGRPRGNSPPFDHVDVTLVLAALAPLRP